MIKPGVPEANGTITQHYYSYLIRIWQGENALPGGWHASLEDPSTQRMMHFSTLEELFAFLRQKSLTEESSTSKKNLSNEFSLS